MTKPNEFTPEEEEAIYAVGRKVEAARKSKRLSLREAAKRTETMHGHMHEATWRRVERGFTQTKLGNIVYRPQAETLWAIAWVLGLNATELSESVGLEGPPDGPDEPDYSGPTWEDSMIDTAEGVLNELGHLAERIEAMRVTMQGLVKEQKSARDF